ncbi:hypothetical protein ACLIR7_09120 [Nitratireductor aquimarinus]|uniref:hypothetical protein n=1 Tax=Nitratireductor aquimarinus TaxID=889300 RepID=UPI00398EC831
MKFLSLAVAALAVLGVGACVSLAGTPELLMSLGPNEFAAAMGAMVPASAKVRGILAVRADASGDVKSLIDGLNKDWSEFKATMAEKDKELAKKFDDVNGGVKVGHWAAQK